MTKIKSDETLSGLKDNNVYLFMDDFTNDSVSPVIEFILEKNLLPPNKRPKHLTLMICSPGGETPSAYALIDIMHGSAIPIHTLGLGQIASCGILTFMSGAKGHRLITPNTSILSHQWSWGHGGKSHELMAVQKEYENSNQRMLAHYKRCTGLDEKTIKKLLLPAHDVWLSAEEAVEYGIADAIKEV